MHLPSTLRRQATLALAVALTLAVAFGSAAAQSAPPRRPKLDRDAEIRDTRDWRAYMQCGLVATSFDRARACFYWAARLDPSRPEPQYAEWLISDLKDTTAHRRALLLDPFMYHARVLMMQPLKPGIFTTVDKKAWGALGSGDYYAATKFFEEYLALRPDIDARWGIAIALYYRQKFDSSAAHLQVLDDSLRHRQSEHLSGLYESLDFVAYMEAVADLAGGRRDRARPALERALTANLAFYHARMLIAELELDDGDTTAAAQDWTQARDLYGDDVVARRRYAIHLLRTGRPAEAETELRAVIAAEPEWAQAYGELALALEAQGAPRRADAIRAFDDFLARAPAEPAGARRAAEARLAALRAP